MPMSTTPETLESLISSTIAGHPHLRHRRVHFETHSGHVVLRGVVGSYYQKQMAQEAVRRLQGVAQVENCLEVDWSQTPC
jgi:osmotically-inducible protein OsmY